MSTLITNRLTLRPFEADDLDAYASIVADPEVQHYMGGPQDRPGAWWILARILGHGLLRGYTHHAIVLTSTRRLIGRAGLWNPEGWPGVEVGWLLARDAWGHGYAQEAAIAWRNYAFERLHLRRLLSVIEPGNVRSVRVAERIGHEYLRSERVDGRESLIYGQTRD